MRIKQEVYKKLVSNSINVKKNKYHNRKVFYQGHWFDSEKEKAHYIKFKLMEKAGEIHDLKTQYEFGYPRFEIPKDDDCFKIYLLSSTFVFKLKNALSDITFEVVENDKNK